MASHFAPPVAAQLVLCLILSASMTPAKPSSTEKHIGAAVDEMQRSGYFSFAMLINMVQDSTQDNVTFFMPSDLALSEAPPAENGVLEFLSRHSIPSPLRVEELKRLPAGTVIPTKQPGYVVNLSGSGGSGPGLRLNGVELVSADVCAAGSSIRCHGIGGVLFAVPTHDERNGTMPSCKGGSCTDPGPAGRDSPAGSSEVSNGPCWRSGNYSTLLMMMYRSELLATIITLLVLLAS